MADFTKLTNEELADIISGQDFFYHPDRIDRPAVAREVNTRLINAAQKLSPGEETHEFVGCIIEIFEEFLEERGIDIPNDEKNEDPDASTIYGSDYGELENGITALLVRCGLGQEDGNV